MRGTFKEMELNASYYVVVFEDEKRVLARFVSGVEMMTSISTYLAQRPEQAKRMKILGYSTEGELVETIKVKGPKTAYGAN